jgi:hypothetical protein
VREKFDAKGQHAPDCACGGYIKTATVSFGQAMPVDAMRRDEQATMDCDLFLAVGSSLVVWPAAGFPLMAKRNGAALVIINREPTEQDDMADGMYMTVVCSEYGDTPEAALRFPGVLKRIEANELRRRLESGEWVVDLRDPLRELPEHAPVQKPVEAHEERRPVPGAPGGARLIELQEQRHVEVRLGPDGGAVELLAGGRDCVHGIAGTADYRGSLTGRCAALPARAAVKERYRQINHGGCGLRKRHDQASVTKS